MLLLVAVFWVGSLAFHPIHSIAFLLESGDPRAELLPTSSRFPLILLENGLYSGRILGIPNIDSEPYWG